jgi:hypothetical protein
MGRRSPGGLALATSSRHVVLAASILGVFGCSCSQLTNREQVRSVHALQMGPADIEGCYQLIVGQWKPALSPGDTDHLLPALVRLDTADASHGGKTITPDIAYQRSRLEFPGFPRWTIDGDTVTMVWSNGFSPTVVRVAKADGKLEGYAEARQDVLPPPIIGYPRAPVVAQRRKCTD